MSVALQKSGVKLTYRLSKLLWSVQDNFEQAPGNEIGEKLETLNNTEKLTDG